MPDSAAPPTEKKSPASAAIEARARELLACMTLGEKVAQMHGTRLEPEGGLYETPANERLAIPGFRMVDGPRGVRAGKTTAFPVGMARGATFDPGLEERVGEAIGIETRARGGNVILAPVVNLLFHPRWGRAQETYGEDSHHLGAMGAAFLRGAQRHVVACVKHYAVNNLEDNRFTVSAELDERTLREVFLPHFEKTVRAGVGSVMSAYNRVRGAYCAENAHLLRTILKDEWGFDGPVISDWVFGTRSTVASAKAGLDIEMPAPVFYGPKLAEAVAAGELDCSVIDDAVLRVLRTKLRFGLFDPAPAPDASVVACRAHVELAREVARKSIVLLKNEAQALPLERDRLGSLAVVGSLAGRVNLGDRGSSFVEPPHAVTPLAGIESLCGAVSIVHVPSDAPDARQIEAIAAADAAVVVAGLTADDEGEGQIAAGDRKSLALPEVERGLIAAVAQANRRTIVVLEGGSAIAMEDWHALPAAILMVWYPGMEGGRAIAEVLLGEASPSGKLPLSFPRSEDQLPPFSNHGEEARYDFLHGYRRLDHDGAEPRYPFGFGLSYTTFALFGLTLDAAVVDPSAVLRARVDVKNTGARAGDEVVQLYVSCPGSRLLRAPRELRAFRRVSLAPGEVGTVELAVEVADLAVYGAASGRLAVEEGEYEVHVGTSSRHLPLAARFQVMRNTARGQDG